MRKSRLAGGTRIVFATEGNRRVVTVEGPGLAEAERQRLRTLMRSLAIRKGVVSIRRDFLGRQRVAFSRDVPEPLQQVIRNIVGNLSRFRPL